MAFWLTPNGYLFHEAAQCRGRDLVRRHEETQHQTTLIFDARHRVGVGCRSVSNEGTLLALLRRLSWMINVAERRRSIMAPLEHCRNSRQRTDCCLDLATRNKDVGPPECGGGGGGGGGDRDGGAFGGG
jgi:hypothetical protein